MSMTHAEKRTCPTTVNVIPADTADTDLGVTQTWITVTAVGGDLFLIFGPDGLAAADSNDWPLSEGEKESFYIRGEDVNRVSISGTGALHWYQG